MLLLGFINGFLRFVEGLKSPDREKKIKYQHTAQQTDENEPLMLFPSFIYKTTLSKSNHISGAKLPAQFVPCESEGESVLI